MAESSSSSSETNANETTKKKPTVILFIGMAGSGKTTLVHSFSSFLKKAHKQRYVINLDPAVGKLPYKPRIDIRDSVNYSETMKEFELFYSFPY